jgi:hypothetical protein
MDGGGEGSRTVQAESPREERIDRGAAIGGAKTAETTETASAGADGSSEIARIRTRTPGEGEGE